jgi:hypothetical protein
MGEFHFSEDQARALAYVLDDIIPASEDGRLPSAGALGLHDALAAGIANLPELRDAVAEGLSELDELARRRHPDGLAALSPAGRRQVLDELAASERAIPPILVIHAYGAYYQHPRVVAALGLEPRPPHPQGYAMEANDLSLLDPVRRRAKMFREC